MKSDKLKHVYMLICLSAVKWDTVNRLLFVNVLFSLFFLNDFCCEFKISMNEVTRLMSDYQKFDG